MPPEPDTQAALNAEYVARLDVVLDTLSGIASEMEFSADTAVEAARARLKLAIEQVADAAAMLHNDGDPRA